MDKKMYQKPTMEILAVECHTQLMVPSTDIVENINNNAGLKLGGGGSGSARTKERGVLGSDGSNWNVPF